MNKVGESWHRSAEKRVMDLGISSALAPIVTLGCLAAASMIALEREVPLFVQERRHGNKAIHIPKLKTYKGEITSISGAQAKTLGIKTNRHGALVRATRVDELPQFLSIIRGDMSIVGVRPIVPSEFEEVMDTLSPDEQRAYLHACAITKPGLVHPATKKVAEGLLTEPRERAASTIEYAHAASRKTDLEALHELIDVAMSAAREIGTPKSVG